MISHIISRMLDNVFSLSMAIKDEKRLRKNTRNFDKNVLRIKEIISNSFAYEQYEYEVFSEPGYYIGMFYKNFHISAYFHEKLYENKDKLYSLTVKNIDDKDSSENANYIAEHLYKLENQKINITTLSDKTIDFIFDKFEDEKLNGDYNDVGLARHEIKEKIAALT